MEIFLGKEYVNNTDTTNIPVEEITAAANGYSLLWKLFLLCPGSGCLPPKPHWLASAPLPGPALDLRAIIWGRSWCTTPLAAWDTSSLSSPSRFLSHSRTATHWAISHQSPRVPALLQPSLAAAGTEQTCQPLRRPFFPRYYSCHYSTGEWYQPSAPGVLQPWKTKLGSTPSSSGWDTPQDDSIEVHWQ